MKKAKVAFGLLFIVMLGLIIYQNGKFFFPGQTLKIDLFGKHYSSPNLPVAIWFVSFFLLGWLLAYLSSLADRFKAGKENRQLTQTVTSQQRDIEEMKKDVAVMKAASDGRTSTTTEEQRAQSEPSDGKQTTDQDTTDIDGQAPSQS